MKRLKLIGAMAAIASFAFLFSCGGSDDGTPACQLDVLFSAPTSAVTGQLITPNNQTLNAVSYSWDFGDGSAAVSSSTLTAPSHYYTTPGSYTITMTAYCEAGQTGASESFSSNVTVTQADPVISAIANSFTRLSDNAVVYPVGLPYALNLNNSEDVNSYTVDWGDGSGVANYTAEEITDLLIIHTYEATGDYTITATGYELPGQAGASDETTLTVTITSYNRYRFNRVTIYPALQDSLGTSWDDGNDGDTDNDNSNPDIVMSAFNVGNDSAVSGVFGVSEVFDDFEVTAATDITIRTNYTSGETDAYYEAYAPLTEWNLALHPVVRSGGAPFPRYAGYELISMIELDGGSTIDGYIISVIERDITGVTTSPFTIRNANGDPLMDVFFDVVEVTE